VVIIVIAAVLFVPLMLMVGALFVVGFMAAEPGGRFGDKIALIHVEGVMTAGRGSSGVFGDSVSGSERVIGMLEKARRDNSVKGVVLRVNSPGGSPSGAQEIYNEISRVRRDGKRVTVSMGDVAASAAYYISCASDRIYADPATMTGSIGVIMETTNLQGLWNKVGIDMGALTTGKFKDTGSPNRPMRPDEKLLLQGMLFDIYDQFVSDVAKGRKLDKAYVKSLADGRIFTGRQALKLQLVDKIGGLQDAIRHAADEAGIAGEVNIVQYDSEGLLDILFGQSGGSMSDLGKSESGLTEVARRLLLAGKVLQLR
jgi:protease-4